MPIASAHAYGKGLIHYNFLATAFFLIRQCSNPEGVYALVTAFRQLVKYHCRKCSGVSIIWDSAIEVN